jgi:hypothetical protein
MPAIGTDGRKMTERPDDVADALKAGAKGQAGIVFGTVSRHNRKRPAGEAGRFWGYYREERYVSLYMWICGR